MLRSLAIGILVALLCVGIEPAFAEVNVGGDDSGQWTGRATWAKPLSHGKGSKSRSSSPKPQEFARATKPKLTDAEWRAFTGMCRRMNQVFTCNTLTKTKPATAARLRVDLGAMARTLVVRLQLPDPTPQIGPEPTANEWRMAAVGYPLWLWTNGPRTVTSRVRAYGITFTLRATWLSTSFNMGDGHTVTCTQATRYTPGVKPGTKSPDCGYTYLTSSLPKGTYTITSTTNWRITWSAMGASGSLPGTYVGSRSLPVGELNALVVR